MYDCLFHTFHNFDAQDQRKPFDIEVIGARGDDGGAAVIRFQDGHRLTHRAEFHPALREAPRDAGKELARHSAMDQQRVERIADRALDF
jgi:hypothetical protein